jgi:MtN3 and saliva related transmembrane protein
MNTRWLEKRRLLLLLPLAFQGCADLGIHDAESLLFSSFKRSEIVGIVAGFGTTFAGLPDLIAMLKRRSSAGMNPRMAAIMCVFQVAWVYYGFLIQSRPVVVWNVIAIVTNALSVGAYAYFVRQERRRPAPR